jgi:hypothetical protein
MNTGKNVPDLLERTIAAVDDGRKSNAMTEAETIAELERLDGEFAQMSEEEHRHFENVLYLRAMIRGWTGDPLCQPASSVLAAYRQMHAERGKSE